MPKTLAPQLLRHLTVNQKTHPRAQPHLSAASGLVCANGRVYVISDDEHHLAVFRDRRSAGVLYRLFPGDLPQKKKARKRLKPDLETLLWLPHGGATATGRLVALGSGSRPNRNTGVVIHLNAAGQPRRSQPILPFDLTPLYRPLAALLGEINIEGAMVIGDELVLLNRAVAGRCPNAAARYRLSDVLALIDGESRELEPASIRRYLLGSIDGVPLGFTDAAALPDGGWLFCAVAEDTADSAIDGGCTGSVVGIVAASGKLLAMHRLSLPAKVEGIAVRVDGDGMTVCLVTDADDPAQSSTLLLARLSR